MTLDEYLTYREMVRELDPEAFERVRTKTPPSDATDFALRVSYVILNSGMRWTVTQDIWSRMKPSLVETGAVGETFGHPGKIKAINFVMSNRLELFCDFKRAWATGPEGIIEFCETLPYIGGITKFHLAKNLGVDTAKPDVWLERVAAKSGEPVQELCSRLARLAGDTVSTVDYVIWKACQQGWWPPEASPSDDPKAND